ncbi:acetate/propionate family kinase [Rubrivivax sp. JA1024]|uniref:acetate/propionate family kinase n=1 Tax=Rubrivivax sp. JA1029 TaxID=2894193 RepID=UPI001E5B23E8|nr:acetate/propionate family kinase [Rubrivivax sp. JA1029]MCC9646738.1 acetate/propionate family kinase [Rubrivivax sp. JA1029]MCD0418497.1 acetate/propionate family kinase [Rubrivivax sp. JA1024]
MNRHESCLVLNAGSSSLKFSVLRRVEAHDDLQQVLSGQIAGIGTEAVFEARDANRRVIARQRWNAEDSQRREALLAFLLDWLPQALPEDRIVAAGHRVVHGGRTFSRPVRVTPEVLAELEALVPLAPLHQPHNLAPMRALAASHPELPQVACFDTAFHAELPWVASTYALPREPAYEGVQRYGFHGLSYEYVSQRLAALRPELANQRIVICHLGNGSSLAAVHAGRGVDTTMGFTALDGLPMGTRCGSLDPGVLLYLMREKGMGADSLEDLLYRRSGLLGVSGLSSDMRVLQESAEPAARRAVELFCFRVAKEVAAMAGSMGGIDALVFTAGIGENSPAVRADVCSRLGWLGLAIDDDANGRRALEISADESVLPVFVLPTNEETMIAMHTLSRLAGDGRGAALATRQEAGSCSTAPTPAIC